MAGASSSEGVQELPTFLDALKINDYEIWGLTLHQLVPVIMSLVIISFLVILSFFATRRLKNVPTGLQALMELLVGGLDNFVRSQIGERAGSAFLPFVGTLFIYILVMNLIGQVPLFHSPTNNLNTTAALALIVFFVTLYCGIRHKGIWGYFRHMMGEPIWMAPIMFPLHLMQEFFTRPLSLAMRLFGNIMGEDTVLAIFVALSPFVLGFIPIPLQLPMVFLGVLASTIQAGIFALLTCFYIAGAVGAHEYEYEKEHEREHK